MVFPMRTLTIITIFAVVGTTAPTLAQTACCGHNPAIRAIDHTCLPAGAPRPELPIYMTDLNEKYQEIATIDSFITDNKCMDTLVKQARDVQTKGQAVGADAVIRVRSLSNKITGFKENPDTPFFSVRQGESNDYFVRGTAIKYLVWPKAEPQALPLKQTEDILARQAAAPIVDTGSILNFDTDRGRNRDDFYRRFDEVTVPEVYSTQPTQGPR